MTTEQLNLDPTVDWVTMPQAAQILEVHPSQVRRDRRILEALDLITYNQRSNGFNREVIEVLWKFRQLVKERGRINAITAIAYYTEQSNER
jgi:hypothetical protein